MSAEEIRILSPIGILGYGINAESLKRGMASKPSMIGVDSGSTDCGPYYLGAGDMYQSRKSMKRDLSLLLNAARSAKIPLIVGSAGLAGASPHVEWTLDILHEIAREDDLHFKLAVIRSDQSKDYLHKAVVENRVKPFPGVAPLTQQTVDACGPIVAQMGTSPYIKALEAGADVIIAGRSCDTAIFASFAVWKGFDRGLSLHMGKILECAGMCAMPPTGRDVVVGHMHRDDFVIEAVNPMRRVVPGSLAGHMVYEVEHPFLQEEPEGTLDFSDVELDLAFNETATRVRGTKFHLRAKPTLRFEGAEFLGHRATLMGGTRDPFLINQIDTYIEGCSQQVRELEADQLDFKLDWKIYGRDAVLGDMEPQRMRKDLHEVGILVQVLAPTPERAHDVAALLEARMIGFEYPNARTRTAHIAFPYSPFVADLGKVYRYSILHVVELNSASELESLFPIEYSTI